MSFLRFALGTLLLAIGGVAFGLYAALLLAAPAAWDGPSANPAVCYLQSLLFSPAAKSADLAALFWGSLAALAAGAVLTRTVPHAMAACALGCLGILGAALACGAPLRAAPGAARWTALREGLPTALERQGKDLGIVAGLGFSFLLIAVFLSFWAHWTASRKARKPKKAAKPAPAEGEP